VSKTKRTVRTFAQAMLDTLMFFPALLLVHRFVSGEFAQHAGMPSAIGGTAVWGADGPASLPFWLVWLIVHEMLGFAVRTACGPKKRLFYMTAFAATSLYALAGFGLSLAGVTNAALVLTVWMRGAQAALPGDSLTSGLYWGGLGSYFLASVAFPHMPSMQTWVPWITGLGLPALIVAVWTTNAATVRRETLSGNRPAAVTAETRRRNRALVALLIAVAVLIASFRSLSRAVGNAVGWIGDGIVRFIRWIGSLWQPEKSEPQTNTTSPMQQLPFDNAEPSKWAVMLQNVLYVVVAVALIALFVVLLVWAAKRAGFWWAKLSDWLKQKWADEPLQEGFVDEKKKLIDWEEWRDLRMERLRQWVARHFEREPGWDDFADDKARVRHAYGRLLRGWLSAGREHKPHLTPAETGREMASAGKLDPAGEATIRLYERVRYGDKQPEVSELEPIRNLFGKRIK